MSYSSTDDRELNNHSRYRGNSRNSNNRTGTISNLLLNRNRRRVYGENDSLSGSRTRSSSRTTSGNPESSRSRSLSPSSDEGKYKHEVNKTTSKRRRFLQRWDDEESDNRKRESDNKEGKMEETEEKEMPYVYQQPEFIRITQDIIRKCEAEEVLKDFFKTLDKNMPFDLSMVSDAQLRKKLRHLSKALYLERNESEFKKPPECKVSLMEVFNELLPFIKTKINLQGPYQRKEVPKEREREESEKEPKRKLTREEAEELLSLREMHEQGFFVDYENVQKEFVKKQKEVDLWGKTPEEQKSLMAGGEKEEPEQAWRVFDREKEFLATSKLSNKEYELLLARSGNYKESFKSVTKSTSFI